jgi:hypothetical protein
MRVIVRRERPHSRGQIDVVEQHDGTPRRVQVRDGPWDGPKLLARV